MSAPDPLLGTGVSALIDGLSARGLHLWSEGEQLRFRGPEGVLTPELRARIAGERAAVLAELRRRETKAAASAEDSLERISREGRLPVSFAQERLWFFDRLEPGSSAYNLHVGWCLRGALDLAALEAALGDLVARHELLRATFGEEDGTVYQQIQATGTCPLLFTELSAPADRDEDAMRCLGEQAERPFDLVRGPLLRTQVVRQRTELYWLLISYHHILGDGWSSELMGRELAALYSARVAGRPAQLSPLGIQYVDFAHWQRGRFAHRRLPEALAYWKRQLESAPPVLELPLDRPRPPVQSYGGATCKRTLDPVVRDRLLALSRAEGATLFVTLMAAFKAMLARHSGQDDVCIGVPVAGRERTELETMVGLFINTVVVRTRIEPATTFRALVRTERETFLGAFANRDAPFERVAKELAPERDLSRTPVFQVLVNMLNFAISDPPFANLRTEQRVPAAAFGQGQSRFDITLYMRDEPAGLVLAAVYNTALFDETRIDDLLEQFTQMLHVVAAKPDTQVMRVSLVTPSQAAILPNPSLPLAPAWIEPVHARFRRHAGRAPDHPAVVDARGSITYGALEQASNRLANHLAAQGIGREDVVAVFADRGAGLAWAMLGVLKAGAAFVVIDPAHPAVRSAQCLRLARPKAWVSTAGAGAVPQPIEAVLRELGPRATAQWPAAAEASPQDWSRSSAEAPASAPGADDLAYVAFTSGSTGEPKAIAGTHRPLAHFFDWHERTGELGPGDRFSALSGLAHDPLLRDVLGAFWVGATLCMPDGARFVEPGYLGDWLARERISVCHLTPPMADLIGIRPDGGPGPGLPALRRAFFGGDLLRADTVEAFRRLAPEATFVNFYGATETPQAMGWHVVPKTLAGLPGRVPLGRGIDGVQLLVLNSSGMPAAVGELGEIHVRTPYLARGYLGDAAATAQRFVPGPCRVGFADLMYRTGDLGRYRPDGSVEFAGRLDAQVKLRGFRIELGEIEAALREHPAVGEATADLVAPGTREARLVGYIVPRAGVPSPGGDLLRDFLRARLPEHMVPAQFVEMDRLPLTPNGKVDRRRLPAPAAARRSRVAPHTPTQVAIAEVWREVLGVADVGAEDNFFELGGHSLVATRVLARLHAKLGVTLPLRALFQAPTVAALARVVEAACGPGAPEAAKHEEIVI